MRLFLIVTVQLSVPISLLGGFESFTVEHGLSHNTINAIAQDSVGYLWIATPDGVSKYDGYSFTQYRHDYSDTTTLPANFVTTLYVDSKGRIWIGTFSGLCRYEPATDGFSRVHFPTSVAGEFPNYTVHAVVETPDSTMLVATSRGLFQADWKTSRLTQPDLHAGLAEVVKKFPVTSLVVEDNVAWIGTARSGLLAFDYRKGTFAHIQHQPAGQLSGAFVTSLRVGRSASGQKVLWVLTADGGWDEMTLHDGTTKVKPVGIRDHPFPVRDFSMLMYDSRGMVWIGTRGHGVLETAASDDGFRTAAHHYHVPGEHRSLTGNFVNSLLEDRWGNIWVGTHNGLNKFTQRQRHIKHHKPPIPTGKEQYTDAFRNVTAAFSDTIGNIWLGNAAGQLFRFLPGERKGRGFLPSPTPATMRGFAILSIHQIESEPGILWVGTHGKGIFRFDTRNGKWRQFTFSSSQESNLLSDQVNAIADDGTGTLWIGTNAGMYSLDARSGRIVRYLRNNSPPSSRDSSQLLSNAVWAILKDRTASRPTLWIGTIGGWMSRFDVESRTFKHFADSTVPALNNRSITTLFQDSAGVLWIGSYSGGLKRLDPTRRWIDDFTMREGLPNNMIQGITQDARGMLWLSTNNGVCRFDPTTGSVLPLDVSDGLQGTQFNRGVALKDREGCILFGGTNGINRFHPDSIGMQRTPPTVVLSGFSVLGEPRSITSREVVLDFSETFLTFEFVALDLTKPRKNTYAYRLDGVDKNWVHAGSRRNATYAHLVPGSYTFRVKASNGDGVEDEKGLALAIHIRPPFWQTWWFLSGCIVVITGLTVLSYRIRMKSLIRRELEIERIREEERENVRIKTARDFHDEMGHRLTRINMLSETASRKLLQSPTEVKDLLDAIRDNANHLFNGTRDFIWSLDARNDSLFDLAARLKDFGDDLFYKTGIAFQAHGIAEEFHNIRLPMEVRRQLMLIFKEALTNSVRHAKARRVRLDFTLTDQAISITLSDDGVGFNHKQDRPGTGLSGMRAR
ncbi:MAG: ATP-binding protein, partial [Bacteroidetes bacterium]|nr:ATP-binding protein [Bacteroidota bacterium]